MKSHRSNTKRLCIAALLGAAGAMALPGFAQEAQEHAQDHWNDNRQDMESDQPVSDTWITTKVKAELLADRDVSGLDIDVETVNGVVTLRGEVESQAQIDRATALARGIKGVTNVDASGLSAVGTDR